MTTDERKAAYEKSALKQLMDANGHEICTRCYCCDLVSESSSCWQCGGFEDDDDPEWPSSPCSVCGGEGEIFWMQCVGNCDENGEHKKEATNDNR